MVDLKFLHRKRCHSLVLKRARPLCTFFLSLAVDATRFFGCSVALVRRRSRKPRRHSDLPLSLPHLPVAGCSPRHPPPRPARTRSTRPRFRLNRTLSKTPEVKKLLIFVESSIWKYPQKKRNFAFSRAATREGKQLVQQAARAMANRPTASFEEKVRVREN